MVNRWSCWVSISTSAAVCVGLASIDALAQSFPARPVHLLVGFTAGGAADVVTRLVAQKLTESLPQPVIVENRAGAGGALATERVARSPADGYTLLMMTAADTALPALRAKLPYDMERDLVPVSMVAISPFLLVVHPSVPARSVKELIALARVQPGKLSYASSGIGTVSHLGAELFNAMAGAKIVHVTYKGGAESVIGTASGETDMNVPNIATTRPFLDSGKLRALAVTSSKRASLLPALPTIHESGLPGYDFVGWWGVLAPAGTPKDVVARLTTSVGNAVGAPEMRESLVKLGFEAQSNTPEQFAAYIRREIAQNAKLIKLAGIKAE